LSSWLSTAKTPEAESPTAVNQHLLDANRNLASLITDPNIPPSVRAELAAEFEQLETLSHKLEEEEIHIAAYGRVGVGKSSLLNALLGRQAFSTSPLHGETRSESREEWHLLHQGKTVLIDTPGIDEMDGEQRAELARDISRRADVILMVCEGDLTQLEFRALAELCKIGRTVLLVLNKSDRFDASELDLLMSSLRQRTSEWLPGNAVIKAASDPRPQRVIRTLADGSEIEETRPRLPETGELKQALWDLLEKDGKSLAAMNAALFASELDSKVASRIVAARKNVAESVIRSYCIAKSLLVAVNPVPVADLLAAAGTDVTMVIHLGQVYGFRLSRREASKLLLTISAQWIALMSAYWGVNLVSSALKTASAGLSAALTATTQGALAWYATYLTGQMAQTWFAKGKSWGDSGPREVAQRILASIDRDSLIRSAREDLKGKLRTIRG